MTRPLAPAVRFWAKVRKSDACWLWTGGVDSGGYGQFRVDSSRKIVAHRFAYESLIGAIPPGLQLDHLCRVKTCVNPEHLEPVTGRVNTLRSDGPTARHARQTHCVNDHPFDELNTYWRTPTQRECRACKRTRDRKRRADAAIGGGW